MQFRTRLTPVLLSLVATSLMAQETTGSVTGRVTNKAGKAIAGAIVRITSPKLLGERTATTDAYGQYRIPIIPGGQYTLHATAREYVTAKGAFQVVAGQVSKADAVLTPMADLEKGQQAVVEIVATTTQVDKTETVTQTAMPLEDINTLMSSNLQAVTYLAPGVANPGGSPRIRGGSGNGTKWLLNGAMVNDQAWGYDLGDTTIQDMIESMAVIQSPLNARYGNTDSGIISMVTTKGSNTFAGSIRAKYWVGGMEATPVSYPDRTGYQSVPYPYADDPSRTYDVTLKGPLWKDHITFAFGGTYSPNRPTTTRLDQLIGDPPSQSNAAGTYFKLPNGTVLRRANTYSQNELVPVTSKSTYNQFVLYWQITTDHQVEWNYTQNDYRGTWYGYNPITTAGGGQDGLTTRVWDLAYKGIIGAHGVLEARFGRTNRLWPHPTTATDPISVLYGKSVIPDEHGNYLANSYLDINDKGSTRKWTNGATSDRGDNFFDDTFVLNYEHVISQGSSSHLIDVGMEKQKFRWDTQTLNQQPPRNFYVPGQLATDYTADELGGVNPATVNGKYIVVNYNATYADVGGVGANRLYDNKRGLIPYLTEYTGDADGTYYQPSMSLYINDLWTISQNHSIMAGLRYDKMELQDSRGTLHSYSVMTPRFEYKWDLFGDQSRLLNVSYGQFHNRVPGGQFQQFVNSRLNKMTRWYWTGTANPNPDTANPNAPYLVDKAAILNKDNYRFAGAYSGPGTFVLDSGWKAPIATEITVGLRRTYADGMYWRTTLVYKTWKNLYDTFPGHTVTQLSDPERPGTFKSTYVRTTRNDSDTEKTYKGFELEWNIPFSAKLKFAGNYTYARTMTNASAVVDSPGSDRTPYGNFRDFYLTKYSNRDAFNPIKLQDPEHNAKAWFIYDLSRPKVKSSVSFRLSYVSGNPDYRSSVMNIGYPGLPLYDWGTVSPSSLGLRNTLTLVQPGFTQEAQFNNSIKYDLEIDVVRNLKFFTSIEINNPFNTRMNGWNGIGAYGDNNEVYGTPSYLTHGWRASSDLTDAGIGSARNSARSFTLEAGLRF